MISGRAGHPRERNLSGRRTDLRRVLDHHLGDPEHPDFVAQVDVGVLDGAAVGRELVPTTPPRRQLTTVERAVRDERETCGVHVAEVLAFEVAPDEAVHHLGRRQLAPRVLRREGRGVRDLPGEEVRTGRVPDQPFVDQLVERTQRVLEGHRRVERVHLEEVEVVRPQPAERSLERRADVRRDRAPTRPRRATETRPCWRARPRRDSRRRDARGCAPTLPRHRRLRCRRSCRLRRDTCGRSRPPPPRRIPSSAYRSSWHRDRSASTRIPVRPRSVSSMVTAAARSSPESAPVRAARGGGRRGHRRGRGSCDGGETTTVRRRGANSSWYRPAMTGSDAGGAWCIAQEVGLAGRRVAVDLDLEVAGEQQRVGELLGEVHRRVRYISATASEPTCTSSLVVDVIRP